LEIGVSVFFVISGFLLYRPFAVAHFRGEPAREAGQFWARRLRRIVPGYWVAFLVVTYGLRADVVRPGWGSLAIYLGFAQIYSPYRALTGITQAWSVCTEMTFYLMLPLWAGVMGQSRRRRRATFRPQSPGAQLRTEMGGLAVLVLCSFAFRIWVLQWHTRVALTMPNWLPGYADLFALGMLLAVVSAYLAVDDRQPAWLWHPALPWASWTLATGAFVEVANIGLPLAPLTSSSVPISLARQTLYGLFAFFVIAPAVFGPQERGVVRGLLRARPLASIGVVSYGVYLWHEAGLALFLRWTGDRTFDIPLWQLFGAVTALALVAAAGSYLMVERPVLRGVFRNRLLGVSIAPPRRVLPVSPAVKTSMTASR
jgi:peptidoglycan/LPS O-acetylase OafA/YrhL